MAAGTLTVQKLNRATGLVVTFAAATATDGDKFANDGKTHLRVKNGDVAPHTVTVASPDKCNRGYTHNEPSAVSVAAGDTREFGPFPPSEFNDADGNVLVTCSDVTSMTLAAVSNADV